MQKIKLSIINVGLNQCHIEVYHCLARIGWGRLGDGCGLEILLSICTILGKGPYLIALVQKDKVPERPIIAIKFGVNFIFVINQFDYLVKYFSFLPV